MNNISVVIIGKNEAAIIGETIRSVQSITDDIIVVDSGSTDGSQQIILDLNARLLETTWDGYGANKNKGIALARHDWIFSIDSDEHPDDALVKILQEMKPSNENVVYRLKRKNFLGKKLIRYGEWGNDNHIRLFNRKNISWNNDKVHEQLILPKGTVEANLRGAILHYTMKDLADYAPKITNYALLNAERYYLQGKKASWFKRYLSSRFSFVVNYIFKGGFLDGREGFIIANMTAYYTFLKYERLYELNRKAV